jgi:hypothetical protein
VIRVLLAVAATVCGIMLVLGYRTLALPRDRLADRVAVAPRLAGGGARHHCAAGGDAKIQVTGPPAAWPLGHVRVRVVLAGCRIADVTVVELATTNHVSRRRSAGAIPRLRGEVLAAQCAGVDVVSGATYTSRAYLRSLQAVLDATHAGRTCP